ncbi:MAG: hypothetical protein SynsKO_28510 [Synoicihabitans sp.]
MNAASGAVVFDEWAVIALTKAGAKLVAYEGPRIEQFRTRFKADIRPLQIEMEGRQLSVGDFAFAQAATGTAYDACVRIGPVVYLWWNHTRATIDDLRESGAWLPAQKQFADLCEGFRNDPVVLEDNT